MGVSQVVIPGLISLLGLVFSSLVAAWLARPKTKAEADNLNAAASVSVSADAREWARDFAQRAERAEERAIHAEQRAETADERCDELEAGLIECYHLVRQMRDHYRQHGETPPALPVRLEALWRATGH